MVRENLWDSSARFVRPYLFSGNQAEEQKYSDRRTKEQNFKRRITPAGSCTLSKALPSLCRLCPYRAFSPRKVVVLCTLFIYTLPRLPNKLLNNPHLCACKQSAGGRISRLLEVAEESLGDFQFTAEEARGGAVFLVGVVTHGEVAERGHHRK